MPSSRVSSQPRDQTCIPYVSCTGGYILHHWCHLVSLTTVHLILKLYMPGGPDINTNTLLAKRRQEEREGIPWRSSGLTPCFHCRNAGDMGSIPGWGTNIPHVTWLRQKRERDRMKRDGEKRSHCLTVSRTWRVRIQSLGWWVIGLRPGLAYPCLSLNSLCLPGPIQSGMLRWRAKCLKVCLSFPDFRLLAFFPPQHEVNICTSIYSHKGCWERREEEETEQMKGMQGCTVWQAPHPPNDSDVSSCQARTRLSPTGRALESSRTWGVLAGQLGRASDHQEFHWGQNPMKRDQQYNRLLIYTLNGLVGLLTQKINGCFAYWQAFCFWLSKSITFSKKGRQHLPEGSDDCCNFFIWIKLSNCMMGPQQFLPIFPPRNSCTVLVHVRYADGAIKLDIFVFRKYYMANRVIKCKGW